MKVEFGLLDVVTNKHKIVFRYIRSDFQAINEISNFLNDGYYLSWMRTVK